MRKNALLTVMTAIVFSAGSLITMAAPEPVAKTPVEIVADSIDYDSASGIMLASGTVRITQGQAVMTGAKARYNTKSQEGHLTGGVTAVKEDTTLSAAEVKTYKNNTQLIAIGDAILTKGDKRLTGPRIEYFSDTQYALVPENGRIEMPDGTMTADKIEAFIAENSATGTGSVHIVSSVRKLDATANTATYYGEPKGQSKVILNGNAHAVQDGNILTGETLTLRLDEKAMDAQGQGGRTKLIITPQ
ncbi:LptA/OstA family protein [Sporomusa malonica]|uniref:Lipopolysaccharide export system protein LptA n=1 Tax=Sporomusa malonica TaxID=112901 RepID=A0A1W1YRE6_9FIRM|nr:LptA/OstA family protein [Sporomusa malonica]SMC38780.1 lipopolysaccharide export system protein LptA [Sporomusa malonica]